MDDFAASPLGSICPTAEERMRVARNYVRWSEDQHYRTAVDFRRGVAALLGCVDDALPWDDVRRVIQGWGVVRFRQR